MDTREHLAATDWQFLHSEFMRQPYRVRLTLFHKYFNLIPLPFPAFDPAVTWYDQPEGLELLYSIFNEEKQRGRSQYERLVMDGDRPLYFRVAPTQRVERDIFNEFVLQHFLTERKSLERNIEEKLVTNESLRMETRKIAHSLEWIPVALKRNPASLQNKFLQIFYNGVLAPDFRWNSNLGVRRKFIELYLYSHGLLLSWYYRHLLEKYHRFEKGQAFPPVACAPLVVRHITPL